MELVPPEVRMDTKVDPHCEGQEIPFPCVPAEENPDILRGLEKKRSVREPGLHHEFLPVIKKFRFAGFELGRIEPQRFEQGSGFGFLLHSRLVEDLLFRRRQRL